MTATAVNTKKVEAEVKARREQFALVASKYLAWATLLSAIFTLLLWFMQPYPQLLALMPVYAILLAGSGLYPIFHRRKQDTLGIYVFITFTIISLFAFPIIVPELILLTSPGYLLVIIFGNILNLSTNQ